MAHALQHLHTFALNNQCQNFVEITHLDQLKTQSFTLPFCLLGEGSNTVFLNDYLGSVIKMATKGIKINERENDYLICVAAGENWHQLVSHLLDKNIPIVPRPEYRSNNTSSPLRLQNFRTTLNNSTNNKRLVDDLENVSSSLQSSVEVFQI